MFDRSALPPASTFYCDNVAKFRARGRRATGLCPFHEDHHPSLSMDLERGLFFCHACGAGGDIPGFIMRRDGVDFATAAKSLNCWEEPKSRKPKRTRRHVVGRDVVLTFTIDGTTYTARVNDDPKNFVDVLRRIHHEAADRLQELRQGDSEKFENETEANWELLSLSWEAIQNEVNR